MINASTELCFQSIPLINWITEWHESQCSTNRGIDPYAHESMYTTEANYDITKIHSTPGICWINSTYLLEVIFIQHTLYIKMNIVGSHEKYFLIDVVLRIKINPDIKSSSMLLFLHDLAHELTNPVNVIVYNIYKKEYKPTRFMWHIGFDNHVQVCCLFSLFSINYTMHN